MLFPGIISERCSLWALPMTNGDGHGLTQGPTEAQHDAAHYADFRVGSTTFHTTSQVVERARKPIP